MERRAVVRQTLTGLAALPERQREALLKIAVEGRSQEEVALALGVSEGAVRQLVHRARLTLRAAATVLVPMPLARVGRGGRDERSRPADGRADRRARRGRRRECVRDQGGHGRRDRDHDGASPGRRSSRRGRTPPPPRAPAQERSDAHADARRGRARDAAARSGRVDAGAAPRVTAKRSRSEDRPPRGAARTAARSRAAAAAARARAARASGSSGSSGSGSSGSGSSGSGSSGSGSSGSGSSGSGSSGSGSSGSGSSGSGSSGSGSSGSGSSGSGSSGSNSGSGLRSTAPATTRDRRARTPGPVRATTPDRHVRLERLRVGLTAPASTRGSGSSGSSGSGSGSGGSGSGSSGSGSGSGLAARAATAELATPVLGLSGR